MDIPFILMFLLTPALTSAVGDLCGASLFTRSPTGSVSAGCLRNTGGLVSPVHMPPSVWRAETVGWRCTSRFRPALTRAVDGKSHSLPVL